MSVLKDEYLAVFASESEALLLAQKELEMEAAIASSSAAAALAIIASAITNGDATHAPSGDAVFDALALKRNSVFVPTVAGDWSPAPISIQEALDQLAARVKALEP